MTLTPRQAAELDPKIAKRLDITLAGELTGIASCSWKGKPAVVAQTDDDLGFISGGMSGRTAVSAVEFCGLTMRTPTLGVLAVAGDRFDVEFASSSAAGNLAQSIATAIAEKASRGNGAIRITEHERLIRSCTYLGGAYMPLRPGVLVDLVFRESTLEIFDHPATSRSALLCSLPYGATFAVETSGPGKVTKGGGFVGGGFGLAGAVEGMAIAAVLNAMTTRTSILTVLTVADEAHEAFFANAGTIPEDLRRALSPIFVRLRQLQRPVAPVPATSLPVAAPTDDIVSKLERLGTLRTSGILTDDEFKLAKAALLAGF